MSSKNDIVSPLIEAINNKSLVSSLSKILPDIVIENLKNKDNIPIIEKQKRFFFHSNLQTRLSINAYLNRILKFTHCEESTLVIGLIFIDRICEINNLLLTPNNVHRLMLIAIISAIKYNEDECYSNGYYAKVGGITLDEINRLEFEFLKLMRYSMFIHGGLYTKYYQYLMGFDDSCSNENDKTEIF